MTRQTFYRTMGSLVATLLGLPLSPLFAEQPLTPLYHQVRGGKLYDNWAATLKIKAPKTNHPAYPANGSKKGANTWRCKECHGWDYKGVTGQYASGEHYTGIVGIRAWQNKEPEQLVAILRNPTHQYPPNLIPDDAARQLALFVSHGQVEMDDVIDKTTHKVKGDPQQGILFFQTICHVCHGLDGKKINLGTEKEPEYLGTAATEDPWEILHKIRYGQPGHDMISVAVLSLQNQADIIAYLQTLPTK